jgi:hypothetical protein
MESKGIRKSLVLGPHDSDEDSDEKSNAWGLNKRPGFIPEDPEKSIADGPNCEKSLSRQ